jgi:hypothetical protein
VAETINKDCKCPYVNCKRHGNCKECRAYHEKRGEKSSCQRGV